MLLVALISLLPLLVPLILVFGVAFYALWFKRRIRNGQPPRPKKRDPNEIEGVLLDEDEPEDSDNSHGHA